jgi:hypothetical protein
MTALAEEPTAQYAPDAQQPDGTDQFLPTPPATPPPDPAQLAKQLKKNMAAVRLAKSKWHLNKKLDHDQVAKAAQNFQADTRYIGASKKLINPRSEKYRACGAILNEARAYWKSVTIPFPEDGVRLIRRDRLSTFANTMNSYRAELAEAAQALQEGYDGIRAEAQQKLGDLFNEADYPADLTPLFSLSWEFPSVDPPNYLLEVDPSGALYEQQKALMEARFQEAIALTEAAFTKSFHEMITHLAERLKFGEQDPETGERKPLVFRDSAVENLQAFFEQFKALNVGSNPDLDALVEQAKAVVADKTAKDLRKDVTTRETVQMAMAEISGKLEQLMVQRPIRQMSLLDEE